MSTTQRTLQRALAAGLLLILSGCGGEAPGSPTRSTAPSIAAASPEPAATQAPATATTATVCDELRDPLSRLLDQELTVQSATIQDLQTGQQRDGCVLEATGTAAEWGSFAQASEQLRLVLAQYRWGPGVPLADGPTGTVIGFAQNDQRLQLSVEMRPGPAVTCPADQPISACNIPPDQQIITIRLEGF